MRKLSTGLDRRGLLPTGLVMLLALPIGAMAQFTPAPNSPFAVGAGANSVAVGDFNKDGIKDLAIANGSDGTVTVLLGNGSAGFNPAPGSPFTVGSKISNVAVGDFNGDGKQDLAFISSDIAVLLGNGSGGFTVAPGSPYVVPHGVIVDSLVVADFNGDGKQDIATTNQGDSQVTVFLGNSSGRLTLAPGTPAYAGLLPNSMAVGDFNGDGRPDLAIADCGPACAGPGSTTGGTVTVLLGDGAGGFTATSGSPFVLGSTRPAESIAVADFNGDGKQDLAVANSNGSISVLLGDGLGGFTAVAGSPFMLGSIDALSVLVGDFNGDGNQDLAALGDYAGDVYNLTRWTNVAVLLGNGSGGFTAAVGSPFWTGTYPRGAIAVGDFNGDGKPDLAMTAYYSNTLTVLLGGVAPTTSVLSTTAGSTIAPGSSVPLTFTVSQPPGGSTAPTGYSRFWDSYLSVGNDGYFSQATADLGRASQAASPYTLTASGLGSGIHTFSALYPGDYRTSESLSNTVTIVIPAVASVNLTIFQHYSYDGTPKSATATVTYNGFQAYNINSGGYTTATITYNGSLTAPTAPGSYTVVATVNDPIFTGSATGTLVISKAAAVVTLGSLSANYDGTPKSVTAATIPANLAVTVTYNGSLTPPTAAGSYTVVATINDPIYAGSATGTLLVIAVGAPSNVIATAVSRSEIDLTWTDNSTSATAILVEKSTDNTTFTQIASLAGTATSYASTGLTAGTQYYYRLRTQNTAGTSGYSNTASAMTRPDQPAITDLGTLGGSFSDAAAINASGQVVGSSTVGTATHPFLYSGGHMTDLGTFGGTSGAASGINHAGQVVGTASSTGDTISHAFLYAGGKMTDLGTLGGSYSVATGINNAGQIVGEAYTTGSYAGTCGPPGCPITHAFLYAAGSMTDIDTLGSNVSVANGINDAGQIVGFSSNGNGSVAFLYSGGITATLGTLPGGTNSSANGINIAGQIFGWSGTIGNGATHSFLEAGGVMTDLASLGCPGLTANGMNDAGQLVGSVLTTSGTDAYLCAGGVLTDLNSLLPANSGWQLQAANAINNAGQIAGYGTINGQTHAFLLDLGLATTSSSLSTTAESTITTETAVPLTLNVSGGSNAPTGPATFLDGTTILGTAGQTASPYTFTASGLSAGSHTLSAIYDGDSKSAVSISNTITIQVNGQTATVTLGSLSATYDKTPKSVTATTTPANLTVAFTYNGSSTAPTAAGSYTVVGTVTTPTYTGSATGTLVISKAPATVTLGVLTATFDQTAKTTTATTNPPNLAVNITYNGAPGGTPPGAGYWAVAATITDPNYTGSATGTFVITPTAPTNLAAIAVSNSGINLTWTNNATNASANSINATAIWLGRGLDGTNFQPIVLGGTAASYSDTGLAACTTYYYHAQAVFAPGISQGLAPYSSIVSATTGCPVLTAPVAPSNVAVGQSSVNPQSQLTVNWQDNSSNETGFEIFRSLDRGKTFSQVATVGPNVITWQDTGLTPATAYYYYVEAYNAAGPSVASNTDWTITAKVIADGGPAPAAPSNVAVGQSSLNPQSTLNLYWQDNSNNEQGFQIFRSLDLGVTFAPLATVGPNVVSYQDTDLSADTAYYYYVKAYNPAGASAASNTDWSVTANSTVTTGPVPAIPGNVVAGRSSLNPRTQINVYWQDTSSNEAGFQIFRSLDGGLTFTQVGTVAAGVNTYAGITSYADTGLTPNTDYKYYVIAYNTAGTSAASNIDGALTAP